MFLVRLGAVLVVDLKEVLSNPVSVGHLEIVSDKSSILEQDLEPLRFDSDVLNILGVKEVRDSYLKLRVVGHTDVLLGHVLDSSMDGRLLRRWSRTTAADVGHSVVRVKCTTYLCLGSLRCQLECCSFLPLGDKIDLPGVHSRAGALLGNNPFVEINIGLEELGGNNGLALLDPPAPYLGKMHYTSGVVPGLRSEAAMGALPSLDAVNHPLNKVIRFPNGLQLSEWRCLGGGGRWSS